MIPVTRTAPSPIFGGTLVPFSTCCIWLGRYPRITSTDPTCASRSCAADSVSATSSARDCTGYRPARTIARTCGGRSTNASVLT